MLAMASTVAHSATPAANHQAKNWISDSTNATGGSQAHPRASAMAVDPASTIVRYAIGVLAAGTSKRIGAASAVTTPYKAMTCALARIAIAVATKAPAAVPRSAAQREMKS